LLDWALPKESTFRLKDWQMLGTRAPSPAIERAARIIVTDFLRLLSVLRTLLRTRAVRAPSINWLVRMWNEFLGKAAELNTLMPLGI
jgi:hypothetical protein